MGHHITLSGNVLAEIRAIIGLDDDRLVEQIQIFDGRVSRLDLAIDLFGATVTPNDLAISLQRGEARIPAHRWRFIDGYLDGVQGQTVDTGSPKSDRRLRFYDKAAEQGIKDGEAWVRLELQLRRLYARGTLEACVNSGCTGTIGRAIGSYLQWSDGEYLTAVASSTGKLMPLEHKDTNRQKWLLGQVSLALAAEVRADGKFLERFLVAVGAALER